MGDPFGMSLTHAIASGMGGIRTAGDLVARMQMAKGMRITQAKRYVADRLGVTPRDLSDNPAMHELRGELRLGRVFETESSYFADPSPLEAKWHIADLLGLRLNAVERLRAGLAGTPRRRP